MKVFIIVLLAAFYAGTISGQNVLSMIPSEINQVQVVKMDKLQEAYKLDELVKEERYLDFCERFDNSKDESWGGFVAMLVYESGINGISAKDMFCSFETSNDSVTAWSYIFPLEDETRFRKFIENRFDEADVKETKSKGEIEYLVKVPYGVAWNSSYAVVYKGNVQYSYLKNNFGEDDYYLEELSERERNERDHEMDKIKEEVLTSEFIKLFSLDFTDCSLSDKNFMQVFNGSYDSFVYQPELLKEFGKTSSYGYGTYSYSYEYSFSSSYGLEEEEEEEVIDPIMQNNHFYHYWHFGDQDVRSETIVELNDILKGEVKKAASGKFEKDFFKYLSGDKIMGYYSVNLNTRGTIEMLGKMGLDIMRLMPGRSSRNSFSSAIIGALIDKKKAMSIFSGSMLFAVTDMHEIDVRYESYSYDQETYERERIIKTKKEMRPEFVGLIGADNEEVVNAYFDAQAENKDFIDMGSYYRVKGENNQYNPKTASVDTYIAYVNKIIVITNNEEIMLKYLESGFPKDKRIPSDWQKKMSSGTFSAYWNLSETAKSFRKDFISVPAFGESMIKLYAEMFDEFAMNGFEHNGNRLILSTDYKVKKEDPISVRFNLIEMMTGLSGDDHPLLKYIK